jgi:cell division protein FtsB
MVGTGYFATYAVWGHRGILALEDARAQLGIQQQALATLQDERGRLEHRIALMEKPGADPDLVEEMARTKLMDGAPGQVVLSRAGH